MGGSGGSSFFYGEKDIESIWDKIKAGEELEKKQVYSQQVNDLLKNKLGTINQRDIEGINNIADRIKFILNEETEGTINLNFGGSISKHTYIDGFSDVDILLLLQKTELKNLSPKEVKDYLFDILKPEFGEENIRKGNLAITIQSGEIETQILPALKFGDHYKISDEGGNSWALIKPKEFASHLSSENEKLSFKLVPIIKLAKAVMSQLPESKRLSGYHTESLAIEAFKNYKGESNYKDLLMHFFKESATKVLKPIKDKSGQSIHVDTYLGKENSINRKKIGHTLENIYKKMVLAEDTKQLLYWEEIV